MEPDKKPSSKCGDVLHKGSSFLSFISLLLIAALFFRMESINRKTEMNELRISRVESCMEIGSPQRATHKNEMKTPQNFENTTNTKVRRSLISVSNKSLSIEDVRNEITKQFNKLKPASLCQPLGKVCVPGPPGKKGNKGSRGRRGAQGAKGKKGVKGIIGLPGRNGQQGIMGNQGVKGEKGEKDSCAAIMPKHSKGVPGIYELEIWSSKFEVYCEQQSWTLIARFSNNDNKNWMRDDGLWWYDQQVAIGKTTDPSINSDMISSAFWLVSGRELKITRSDDPSHTPLLQTTGNCLAGQTFRSKITSYGDFRNGKVWASDQCLGSCRVQYGGQYKSTDGFQQAECSGDIQSANNISFWCDWKYDGSVMMIGGGGRDCSRADHGIGITESNAASFVLDDNTEHDFGFDAHPPNGLPSKSYSLNLWIR